MIPNIILIFFFFLYRSDCEQSELWLDKPEAIAASDFMYRPVLHRVIETLKTLSNLCFMDVDDQSTIQVRKDKNQIMLSRQIMLRNLEVNNVVIKLMKESFYLIKDITEKNKENSLLLSVIESNFRIE